MPDDTTADDVAARLRALAEELWRRRTDPRKHTIVCRTVNTPDWGYDYAQVELDPETARGLLAYRPLVDAPKAFDDQFYALEFFDYTASYGRSVGQTTGVEHGEFVGAPPGWELEPDRTAADMLRVMPDGVMWTAQPKHGDGEFETETVTWEQLEQVAAGGWPFEPAETSPEDDAGEDDDAD